VARRASHRAALDLTELDTRRGSSPMRRGKDGRRREVGMDDSATGWWPMLARGMPVAA